MGGAVKAVASVAAKAQEIGNFPAMAAKRTIAATGFVSGDKLLSGLIAPAKDSAGAALSSLGEGKTFSGAVGDSFGKSFKMAKSNASNLVGAINPQDPLPTVVSEDPAQVSARSKKEREDARRKAEIDIGQDQPGRGGILTNGYGYKV